MVTSLYSGKDSERPIGFLHGEDGQGTPVEAMNTVSVVIMERIASLFDRIRRGGLGESCLLGRVLPALLDDFFPPRQVRTETKTAATLIASSDYEHRHE